MATAILNETSFTGKSSGSVSVGQAARMLDVSPQSIRNYSASGELEETRTLGGHRRITVASIRQYQGFDAEETTDDETADTIVYARVSTNRQKSDGNLSRQVERLQEHCQEAYGIESVTTIQEVGSGLNGSRRGYLKLVSLILSGKIRRVVCEYKDRLSRSDTALLEMICDKQGVELVCTERTVEATDPQSEMVADLLAIVTVYANRSSGIKGGQAVAFELSPEFIQRVGELRSSGLSQKAVAEQVKKEGITCPKTNKVYTSHAVGLASKQAQLAESFTGKTETDLSLFLSERCKRVDGSRAFTKPLYKAFKMWAEKKGITAIGTDKAFTNELKRSGIELGKSGCGYRYLVSYELVGCERAKRSHLAEPTA